MTPDPVQPDPLAPPSTALSLVPPSRFAVTATEGRGLKSILDVAALGAGIFDLTQLRKPAGEGSWFQIPDERGEIQPAKTIEGVIVAARSNLKAWFVKPFSETGGGSPPDCSSGDGLYGFGLRDIPAVPNKAPSKLLCKQCPYDQFGSARKGAAFGKGKDCQDYALLLVYRDKDFLPVVLKATATDLKELKKYSIFLSGRGRDRTGVTTIIGLNQEQNTDGLPYSTLTFRIGSFLDEVAAKRFSEMEVALSQSLLAKFDPAQLVDPVDTAFTNVASKPLS